MIENGNLLFISFLLKPGINVDFYIPPHKPSKSTTRFKIKTKNILQYNAYQNILFYKMNVIDEKLTSVVTAKDKSREVPMMDVFL